MRFSSFVLLISVLLLLMGSCQSETDLSEKDLVGKWKVVFAQRNGRATELVNGAMFVFDDKGYMNTDITGVEDKGSFTVEEMVLIHHGERDVLYTLNKLTRDSMQLVVDLQGLNFVLDLVRLQSKR